ncbi:MAG: TolC family protein [Armatimonadota bacterium]|jgi:outer membrane protein
MSFAYQPRCHRAAIVATAVALLALGRAPTLAQARGRLPTPPEVTIAGPLTLDQALELALTHQPVLSIARRNVTAAAGATRQTRSDFLPSVSLRSDFSRSMSEGQTVVDGVPIGESTRRFSTQYRTSFGLNQLIYDFGRTADEYRRSRLQEQATQHQRDQTEDDVINAVQQGYLVLLTNQELLEVAQDQLRFQQGTVEWTQAHFDAGRLPRADVARAASAQASAQLDVTASGNAVALSRVALNDTMGIDVRTQYDVAPLPEAEPTALTLDELIAVAMERRPEVLAAQKQLRASEAGLRAARKGHMPSITGGASLGWREPEFHPSLKFWGVSVGMNLNVFDGWFTEGREQVAVADRGAARDAVYDTMELVATETAQSFLDLRTAEQQIVSAEAAVASADEALRLADGRYRAEVGILLEVLDAQAALTLARADRARARFDHASARYALERAIGVPLAELEPGGETD